MTHIIGLRPFMSQLLCEQVVGRGLRRASYEVGEDGLLAEEIAQVFGVPFEVIPFKGSAGVAPPRPKRWRVYALAERVEHEIVFPRVVGYTQGVRNRVTVDWERVPTLVLTPGAIPTTVRAGTLVQADDGNLVTARFGKVKELSAHPYLASVREQQGVFEMARDLTREFVQRPDARVPAHVLFPQFRAIAARFVRERVEVPADAARKSVFTAPYHGWAMEILLQAVRPDEEAGEAPELPRYAQPMTGTTADVDYWTSRDVWPATKSHLNFVVADSGWEKQAAFYIDGHRAVRSFVKNAGVGLAIPYLHNGQPHDFVPDFIIRLEGEEARYLLLETKGHDELWEVKKAAAERWVAAVNAIGAHGQWTFAMARSPSDAAYVLQEMGTAATGASALRNARLYGVDIGQLQSALRLTPAERVANLDDAGELGRELDRVRRKVSEPGAG